MSTYCLEQAEQLHADLADLKAIEVKDADSVCAYIKGYWEFIINHKMFGSIWDIYADEIEVRRENGFSLVGIQAVENNYMNLCAAFPDLHMDVAAIFAAPAGESNVKYVSGFSAAVLDTILAHGSLDAEEMMRKTLAKYEVWTAGFTQN